MMREGRIQRVPFRTVGLSLVAVVQDSESISVRLAESHGGSVGSGLWRRGKLLFFQVDGDLSARRTAIRRAARKAIAKELALPCQPDPVSRPGGTPGDYRTRLQIAARRAPDMVGQRLSPPMQELLARMPLPVGLVMTSGELMALLGLVRRGLVRLQGEAWYDARPWQSEAGSQMERNG